MEKIYYNNGNITIVDTLTGKCSTITKSEIEDFHNENSNDYTKEWREATRVRLTSLGLSSVSICLMINGRFDHRKNALREHLKRVNRLECLDIIWSILK